MLEKHKSALYVHYLFENKIYERDNLAITSRYISPYFSSPNNRVTLEFLIFFINPAKKWINRYSGGCNTFPKRNDST